MNATCRAVVIAALGCALPASGWAGDLVLRSELPGYLATQLSVLPAAPEARMQECRSAPATSPAGKAVAAAGWQVVSEKSLGGHMLVSFAASSSPGPAGVCDLTGGNLGVFEGSRLVGLYWSAAEGDSPFGRLQIDREGVVDLHGTTFPVVPVAEITRLQDELVLRARPVTLAGCGGVVEVPQLWLEPIGTMRERLIALGWVPMSPPAQDPVSADMQAQGFPETESCSGTGANYCSYDYTRPEARLRVISVGELGPGYQPSVADYELSCL